MALLLPVGFAHAQSKDTAAAPQGTLWRRADQVAARRMDAGQEAYRKGDFADAEKHYDGPPRRDAHYNLGNALASRAATTRRSPPTMPRCARIRTWPMRWRTSVPSKPR
jgi:hypothetical protein